MSLFIGNISRNVKKMKMAGMREESKLKEHNLCSRVSVTTVHV